MMMKVTDGGGFDDDSRNDDVNMRKTPLMSRFFRVLRQK